MALGSPFTLTIGAKIAGIWFGDNERALATTVTSVASVMGVIIGFVFPVLIVPDKETDPNFIDKLWLYTLVQSILISALAIPIFFLVKNQPKTPPSKSAKDVLRMKKRKILESIKKLVLMPNYWVIVVAYSLIFSCYIVLGASVGAISDEFGYDTSSNSIFGAIFIICGIIGSIVNAIILDKYKKYKRQFNIIGILACVSIGFVAGVISIGSVALSAVALACLGATTVSIIGVGFSFASEIAFPIGEAIS
jgi:FLVCR family feline leukemia virus subgroup C receptor-related protein